MKSAYNSYYEHHDGFWKFKKKTIRRDMDQFVIFLIFIRIHFTNYLNYYLEKKNFFSAYTPGGSILHNLGVTPDLVVVQLKMWDGFVYEADGKYVYTCIILCNQ